MLVLSNVDAGYGGFQALFDVSMTVEAGEAVAVIGANGAGKTTLLRVISGLLPASRGDMTMEGVRLTAIAPHRIVETGIAHVPESRRLFPRLTVEGNLKMGAFIPAARAGFAERLAYVYGLFPRLKERRNQLAGTMSGGEQQMLAMSRALASDPALLILDELSRGLAPLSVDELYETVSQIAASGVSILCIEQFARTALRVADYAAVMSHGRVVATGEPVEILQTMSDVILGGAA
ncbi:MAG: ABC transporter ATP-binding protein [Microvirga sp.]